MAAVTLSLSVPDARALSTNAQEYAVPANCRRLLLQNRDASIKLRWAYAGTDGAPLSAYSELGPGAQIDIPAFGAGDRSRNLDSATRRIYLSAASGTPTGEILALP